MPGPRPKYPSALSETQGAEWTHLSLSYTAPYAEVQRARIVLLAHQHPTWANAQSARIVGCTRDPVKEWRRRWTQQGTLATRPRAGGPRRFPVLVRAQVVAWACSTPSAHGKVGNRWSGEKLAQGAMAQGLVTTSSPATMRPWLREEKIKPWRSH